MSVTAVDVRRWVYRYLQSYVGWFDTPDWQVEGDEYIPRLVATIEQLVDYVSQLDDDDPRLVALADALNESSLRPEDLEGWLYPAITSAAAVGREPFAPDDFFDRYTVTAARIARANSRRRRDS